MYRFLAILGESDELRAAVTDRDIPTDARTKLVADLLHDRAHDITTRLATYAALIGRPRDFPTLIEHLVERVAAETNRRLADVRSAVEMDDEQRQHLAAALKAVVGHDVHVRVTVDPSLLAGFVATVGDTVVDGSARHRLEILKERLVMPEVRITTGEPN
jgi:F-type H+-transporting ATPase subunit delta